MTDELKREELLEWHKRTWQTRISFGDRPLFEEEQAHKQIKELIQKPEVTEEFVEKWADKFDGVAQQGLIINIDLLKQMLKEAGVEAIPSQEVDKSGR